MPSWDDLPPELKSIIASHLASSGLPLAPLSTISRSWAAAVEPLNFSRLRLTPARIPQLREMTRRNRGMVRHLWVCLELARYGCPWCLPFLRHRHALSPADEVVIAKGLWGLFATLSTWEEELDGGSKGRGVTLDISVYSPSDSRHWFKHASIVPDDLDGWTRVRKGSRSLSAEEPAAKRRVREVIEQAARTAEDEDDEDDRAERHRHITHRLGYGLPQTAICRVFDVIRGGDMSADEVAALLAEEEELGWDDAGAGDDAGCDSDSDGSGCGMYRDRAERVFRDAATRMMGMRWIQRRAHQNEDVSSEEEEEGDSEGDSDSDSSSDVSDQDHVHEESDADDPRRRDAGECWWTRLPPAPVVRRLTLRQQTRRRWGSGLLAGVVGSLPGLREVVYEPWREWHEDRDQARTDGGESLSHSSYSAGCYITLLQSPVIENLSHLSLFENTNREYARVFARSCRPARRPSRALAAAVFAATRGIQDLAVSFAVDAREVFRFAAGMAVPDSFGEEAWWPRLRCVALTTPVLAPGRRRGDVMDVLVGAAEAAGQMPRLEVMEIWNGRPEVAALFRYEAAPCPSISASAEGGGEDGDELPPAVLTWKATWDLRLSEDAIEAWRAVAGAPGVEVVCEVLDPEGGIGSHGDAVRVLELRGRVMRPVSAEQVCWEQRPGMERGTLDRELVSELGPPGV